MDPFSAFKSEVFRPLATIVIPGLIAAGPFIILLCNADQDVASFYSEKTSWFMAAVLAVATAVGMLIENIGSSIERGIDRCLDNEYLHGHVAVWSAYLSCGVVDNNGRRFLGSIVTRLKYINSLMPALSFFLIGLFAMQLQVEPWRWGWLLTTAVFVFIIVIWLFRTSTELSEVASNTRFCLLSDKDRPVEYDSSARTVRRLRHFAYVMGEIFTSRVDDVDLKGKSELKIVPIIFKLLFLRYKTKPPSH